MSLPAAPLTWAALAIALVVVGLTADGASCRRFEEPRLGAAPAPLNPEPAGAAAPLPGHVAPGDLVVRYGGDVGEAQRVLGSRVTRDDFARMRALGVDAVAIDCRVVAAARQRAREADLTLEGDERVRAAVDLARAEGLHAMLWPVVVASPSGPRLDDLPGLLDDGRLRRERQLRVAVARRLGAPDLLALDGRVASAVAAKGHPLEVSSGRLRVWRAALGDALRPEALGVPALANHAILDDVEALARAAGGPSGIPDDWGLGVWVDAAAGTARAELEDVVARCRAAGGTRLLLLAASHAGGDGAALADLAAARAAGAPDAVLVVGTWRYGGGGLAGLAPGVWAALVR